MIAAIRQLARYIVCSRVTKRPIFEYVCRSVRPNDALMVFPYQDDYSFGVLQSNAHWRWFVNRCSTMKGDPRYTSNTVFDSFPWPQQPTKAAVLAVASAANRLRTVRRQLLLEHGLSLRELYRSIDLPGSHPLKDVHDGLDQAIAKAYDAPRRRDILAVLLDLNREVAGVEARGGAVTGPGLPRGIAINEILTSTDCIGSSGWQA